MGTELLAVPEERLAEVILVIRMGLGEDPTGVSDETRAMLDKWCDEHDPEEPSSDPGHVPYEASPEPVHVGDLYIGPGDKFISPGRQAPHLQIVYRGPSGLMVLREVGAPIAYRLCRPTDRRLEFDPLYRELETVRRVEPGREWRTVLEKLRWEAETDADTAWEAEAKG